MLEKHKPNSQNIQNGTSPFFCGASHYLWAESCPWVALETLSVKINIKVLLLGGDEFMVQNKSKEASSFYVLTLLIQLTFVLGYWVHLNLQFGLWVIANELALVKNRSWVACWWRSEVQDWSATIWKVVVMFTNRPVSGCRRTVVATGRN